MSRYLPIILGGLVIIGLTIPQILMSDRFAGSNVTAEQRAKLLEGVPKNFVDWVGEDMPVTDVVRKTAGVIGAPVSRTYRNSRTGEVVSLWLIVGHARAITAHTPNICFPASGFFPRADEDSLHTFAFEGQPEAPFLTNTFVKEDYTGRRLIRVFWSWHNPIEKGPTNWQASKNARWHFGNSRALFKMYFTSEMRDPKETTEESPCNRFAREFLPIVDQALSNVYGEPVETVGAGVADDAEDALEVEAEPVEAEPATAASSEN